MNGRARSRPPPRAEKTHKTAIVLIPPKAAWPPIQAIRERYDRQFRRWMPHITLVYPFHPVARFARDLEPLQRTCRSLKPFQVELAEFRWFRHREQGHSLWLAPTPRHSLVLLQRTLVQAVPDCDDVGRFAQGFEPHLSVGQVQSRGRLDRVLEQLQQGWQPLEFLADRISLIARGDPPKDSFRVVEEIALGG